MKTCFLFGHADCPSIMLSKIEGAIENCYSKHGITDFYVGNRGNFDRLAAVAAKKVKQRHEEIKLFLVLAYHPAERRFVLPDGFDGSYYPPLEGTPRRYAVVESNRYLIDTSNAIICYVDHIGNTGDLLAYARRKRKTGKIVIDNIAGTDQGASL